MPRYRTIKPKIWDDKKFAAMSRDARLTYIAMWNFSDDLGVLISDSKWLKSKIYPYDVMQLQYFEKLLAEINGAGFISLFPYKQEKFYYLPALPIDQVINRPNYEDVNVPAEELEQLLEIHGLITDDSLPKKKGKEKRGEEQSSDSETILNFPFEGDDFKGHWQRWKIYKQQQHKFTYKSPETEQQALISLKKLADDEVHAVAIIDHTIGNGWKGFVKPEKKQANGTNQHPITKNSFGGSKTERVVAGQNEALNDLLSRNPGILTGESDNSY